MSGQAKQARVRAALRHREQVARLIAHATDPQCESLHCGACGGLGEGDTDEDGDGWCIACDGWYEYSDEDGTCQNCGADMLPAPPCEICGGSGAGLDALARAILGGQRFDVSLARAYGERLVAEGVRAAENWVAFVDWTRARGEGPENFGPGWPGLGAADWACGPGRVKCEGCKGSGRATTVTLTSETAGPTWTYVPTDSLDHECPRCDGRGTVEGPRPQPGGAQIRMGRRLLSALEGQSSECTARYDAMFQPGVVVVFNGYSTMRIGDEARMDSSGRLAPDGEFRVGRIEGIHTHGSNAGPYISRTASVRPTAAVSQTLIRGEPLAPHEHGRECDCRGTGHNLSGVLPVVEWPAVVGRKVVDSFAVQTGENENVQSWVHTVVDVAIQAGQQLDFGDETRVVPRGQHRDAVRPLEIGPEGDVSAGGRRICRGWSMRVWVGSIENDRADAHVVARDMTRLPRWRRGELRHDERRRVYETRPRQATAATVVIDGVGEFHVTASGELGERVEGSDGSLLRAVRAGDGAARQGPNWSTMTATEIHEEMSALVRDYVSSFSDDAAE